MALYVQFAPSSSTTSWIVIWTVVLDVIVPPDTLPTVTVHTRFWSVGTPRITMAGLLHV